MVAGRSENPFTAGFEDAAAGGFARAIREGLEDREKREARKPEGLTKEYVGKTGWRITVSGTPGERGWLPGQNITVKRGGGRGVSEALNPKAAERAARGMESFAQFMALAMMRAVDNNPSAAAGIARELAVAAGAYEEGTLILSGETIAGLDKNRQGRADWAMGKIEGAIRKFGRDEVADVLNLLAAALGEERIR